MDILYKKTKNEISIKDNYALIHLYDRFGKLNGYSKIDIEDIDKVRIYKVGLHSEYKGNRYAQLTIKRGNQIYLHKFIMNYFGKEYDIDHINGDGLDNRKCNLRIVTHKVNNQNHRLQCNNTSGYPGVHYYKSRNNWSAQIMNYRRKIFLGYFKTKEEAILKRKLKEIELGYITRLK